MTLNELKTEVIKLGFEHDIDDEDNFVICANRALKIMLAERKITRTVLLNTADYIGNATPESPFFEIDFTAIYPDFVSFVNQIKGMRGEIITSIVASDGILYIPKDLKETVIISYQRLPDTMLAIESDIQIDMPRELEHALPLLVASFLWLDDDEAKAQYYLALYRDLMNTVRRYGNRRIDTTYYGNGWA